MSTKDAFDARYARHVKGRRLEPIEAFEVIPWRALALFRVTTLGYVLVLTVHNVGSYPHPYAAWAVSGVMVVWSGLATAGYERSRLRAWPLLVADLAVTAGCLLATGPVVGPELLARGMPTLTVTWMACPVLAVAVVKGIRWGITAAVLIGACDLSVRGVVTQNTVTGTVIMVMAAAALGYLGNIGTQAQEHMRQGAAFEAAHAERERLARSIHDSVLQVLALVQRQGEEIGGRAAELGRLAGEQEVALRALIGPHAGTVAPAGMADLRQLVRPFSSSRVTVSAPATEVWLPAPAADELVKAVTAATDNVSQHCPQETKVWILVEDEPDRVTVTVRDDGPGIEPGRLEQAAAQGRLGVALSIRGRVRDLGGTAAITSAPGQGTEVELTMRRKERPVTIRVMVVDDHPMWRNAVARDLEEGGYEVVAAVGDGAQAIRVAAAVRPDVVVLDLQLPDISGVEVLRGLLRVLPTVRVLVLSASGEQADVLEAVKAGATGYLVKSAQRDEFLDAVRRTANGDAVFTAGLAGLVLGEFRRLASPDGPAGPDVPSLTDRETEVLRLVAKGLSYKDIADRLVLSHRTVQNHVQNTLTKLQLHNRVELTRYAIEQGLD